MAVIWSRRVDGRRFEVRTAGNTRRLYADGVLHSQYNPRHGVTGSVWDLLWLPAMFYPQGHVRRVLVLGVGGGAVIRMLKAYCHPTTIIGVDCSAVHLSVARRFFGVTGKDVRLVQGDAMAWLRGWQGEPFDLVIDDLFGEVDGQPVRAIDADPEWMRMLSGAVAPDGALVMNFESVKSLRRCAWNTSPSIARQFRSAWRLTTPQNDNVVAAWLKRDAGAGELRDNLCRFRELDPSRKSGRLNYSLRRLSETKSPAA